MKLHSRQEMHLIPAIEISDGELLTNTPTVSILMMTRNHQEYIDKAVESVIDQNCDFQYEIIIGEDFSSDNTLLKCKELQRRYPQVIRLVNATENVGITKNFLRLAVRARGQYSAFLEGDDYWTATDKLQKQVDLMEANANYSWCGAKTQNRTFPVNVKPYYTLTDTLRRYIIHTSTVMYRSSLLEEYPAFPDFLVLDSVLFSYLSTRGHCGFINQTVSYYRVHEGGFWTGASLEKRTRLTRAFTHVINDYFLGKYEKEIYERELWILTMDCQNNIKGRLFCGWMENIVYVNSNTRRMLSVLPREWSLFYLKICFQPLLVLISSIRMRVGIRTRLKSLFD